MPRSDSPKIARALPGDCPTCGCSGRPVRRGLSAGEVIGVLFLVLITCGLASPLLLGLPILSSKRVCPACKAPR